MRVYTFILKYLLSEARSWKELSIVGDQVPSGVIVRGVGSGRFLKRDQRARLGARLWEGGGKRVRLAFALFLEITLFVVLLSLYIHGWKIYMLYGAGLIPAAYLAVRKTSRIRLPCAFYPSSLSPFSPSPFLPRSLFFSPFLSFSFSLPPLHRRGFVILRCRRQYMRRRECANPRRGFRRSGSARFTRELFTRPVAPGDTSSRRFPMTSLPRDVRVSTTTSSSRRDLETLIDCERWMRVSSEPQ